MIRKSITIPFLFLFLCYYTSSKAGLDDVFPNLIPETPNDLRPAFGGGEFPNKSITGIILDEDDEPVLGASIREKGNETNGTISDEEGKFELNVSDENGIIIISAIGFTQKEQNVSSGGNFSITLKKDNTQLQDVVVTAFAEQKKATLTGAISVVSGTDLVEVPAANITSALIGQAPGVNGLQTTGEPGRNGYDIKIRGLATYGNSNPLIVIDGIEQPAEQGFFGLDFIDPDEVDNISILKDASATAVYGIRGANGVLIITTKRGKAGRPRISVSGDLGFTSATMTQNGLDSYHWAALRNESIENEIMSFEGSDALRPRLFSDDDLWKFQNNRDFTPEEIEAMDNLNDEQKARLSASPALYYQSADPYHQLFSDKGPQRRFNLNVSGGSEKVKYFTSFGYFNQDGFNARIKYYGVDTKSAFRRYNFRSNFDIDAFKNFKITLNIAGQFGKMQGVGSDLDPYDTHLRYNDMMHMVVEGNPIQSLWFIDGKLASGINGTPGTDQNPLGNIIADSKGGQGALYYYMSHGTQFINNSLLDNSIKFEYSMPYITKGLKLLGTINFQDNYSQAASINNSIPTYRVQRNREDPNVIDFLGGTKTQDSYSTSNYDNWNKLYLDGGISYQSTFNRKHNILALVMTKASRYTMPGDVNHTPSGILGYLGRITYNYSERYLMEVNMGYNGTEQFAKGRRFGFFPAYSIGWIPTLEPFFPENDILTFLKIRASYGQVGNDLLEGTGRRYLYLPNAYSGDQSYYLGTSDGSAPNPPFPGLSESSIGNPNITWEKAVKMDFGIEAFLFQNRLTLNLDLFREKRNNILTTLGTIPDIYGVAASAVPPANVGRTKNEGYEFMIKWEDEIGERFRYLIEGHITRAKNKILYRDEPPNPYDWMNATGNSIGTPFGLRTTNGFYNTNEELNNRPYNSFTGNRVTLGDIKYLDLNGDGVLSNLDIGPIGYPTFPQYFFGIRLRLFYGGFALSALLNGSMRGTYYLPQGVAMAFDLNGGEGYDFQWDGRWTQEKYNNGENITFPRMSFSPSSNDHNFLRSDFWARSTDFMRLKNIQASYTFTLRSLKKIGIQSLSLYVSGNNLFTFKNHLTKYGVDPEQSNPEAYKYMFPLIRVYNSGFNIRF